MQNEVSPHQAASRFEHFKQLDGLRGVSIILVLIGHIAPLSWTFNQVTLALGQLGSLGVLLFFVLSGFLITGLLLDEENVDGKICLPKFYMRRVLRIMPAYYLMLGSVIVLMMLSLITDVPWYAIPINAFYLSDFAGRGLSLGHTWSLSVEEQFYLLWPWFLSRTTKHRITVALLLAGIAPVCRAVAACTNSYEPWHYVRPYYWLDAILIGCSLALVWTFHRAKMSTLFERFNAGIVFFGLIGWTLGAPQIQLTEPFFRTVQVLLAGLLLANLVVAKESRFAQLLCSNTLRWFGKISYSLYLWQQLFLVTKQPSWGILREWPIDLACTIALATLSYYFVELPFLRVKKKWEPAIARTST